MAKLLRKFQKIFGVNTPDKIGVVGSLAAGLPQTSDDPDDIQSLSNYEGGWTEVVVGENAPAIQDVNGLDFLETRQLAYLFQAGIPEWDTDTTYYIGSYASDGLGGHYQSLTDDNQGNALSDIANWVQSTGPKRVGDFLVTEDLTANSVYVENAASGIGMRILQIGAAITRGDRANGSIATPTTVVINNTLDQHEARGYDGSAYTEAFRERVIVPSAPSAGIVPGRKEYFAARVSDGALVLAASITEDGVVFKETSTADSGYGTITSVALSETYRGAFNYTFDANAGFLTAHTVTIRYSRVGKSIQLLIGNLTATADAVGQLYATGTSTPIPVNLRPMLTVAIPVQVLNNGTALQAGLLRITDTGLIRFYAGVNESSSYTASTVIGWQYVTPISYMGN